MCVVALDAHRHIAVVLLVPVVVVPQEQPIESVLEMCFFRGENAPLYSTVVVLVQLPHWMMMVALAPQTSVVQHIDRLE